MNEVDLSIIIVNYNTVEDVCNCLKSIDDHRSGLSVEVFVVDNASADCSVEAIHARFPWVRLVLNQENVGFPTANNQAIRLISGRYVMLLNPDTIVLPNALPGLVSFMDSHATCGICGPKLMDGNGMECSVPQVPTLPNLFFHFIRIDRVLERVVNAHPLTIVSGACLVIRRSTIKVIGLLDEQLFWIEDVDYCVRMKAGGYDVLTVPNISIIHLVGRSASTNLGLALDRQYKSKIRYVHKHFTAFHTRIAYGILTFEVFLKATVWGIISKRSSKQTGIRRAKHYRDLLRSFPACYREVIQPEAEKCRW